MVVYSWEASGSTAAWPADQDQANHAAAALHPRTPTDMFAAMTHSKSLVIQAAPLGVPQGQVPRSCHEQCAAAAVSGSAGTCSAPHTHTPEAASSQRGLSPAADAGIPMRMLSSCSASWHAAAHTATACSALQDCCAAGSNTALLSKCYCVLLAQLPATEPHHHWVAAVPATACHGAAAAEPARDASSRSSCCVIGCMSLLQLLLVCWSANLPAQAHVKSMEKPMTMHDKPTQGLSRSPASACKSSVVSCQVLSAVPTASAQLLHRLPCWPPFMNSSAPCILLAVWMCRCPLHGCK